MKSQVFALLVAVAGALTGASSAWADRGREPKISYVGLGRSTCSGSSVECMQVEQNNRMVERENSRRYEEQHRETQEREKALQRSLGVTPNDKYEAGWQR